MNVSFCFTMNYEQKTMNDANKKQTQSNPTCSELVEPISKGTIAQSRGLLTESGQVGLNYSGGFYSVVYQSASRPYQKILSLSGASLVFRNRPYCKKICDKLFSPDVVRK